jgi:hypothetical protein
VPAEVIDHRIPHRGNLTLFWDRSNWDPLCVACHNAKSAREKHAEAQPTSRRFVVTGLPGVGKSTWASEHAAPGQLVWDADQLARVMFRETAYPWSDAAIRVITSMRANLVRLLKESTLPAILIISDPDKAKAVAAEIGAELVTLECPDEERQRRLQERKAAATEPTIQ